MKAKWDIRAFLAHRVLAAFLALVLCAAAAQAQITTPVDLGSNQANGTASTSLAVTTTANAPAGGSIIVIADASTIFGPQATGATCSDSAGNTYTTDVTQNGGVTDLTAICSTHSLAAQLSAGATITVRWAGTAPNGQLFLVHAFAVTGLAGAALDKTASTAGTGSSASSGATATTAQANELLVAAFLDTGSTASNAGFIPGTNGTANNCAGGSPSYTSLGGIDSQSNPPSLFGAFCIVSATGAYSANATLTGNPFWQASLATYKAAPPSPTISMTFGAASIVVGGTTTLSFTINDPAGNLAGLTAIGFTDSLPPGLAVATPNGLTNSCGGTPSAVAGSGTISLSGGSVALGSSCTLSVNVIGTAPGNLTTSIPAGAGSYMINLTGHNFPQAFANIQVLGGAGVPVMSIPALAGFALLLAGMGCFLVRRAATFS